MQDETVLSSYTFINRKKSPSPPITTNHNNTEAWPSLQREGGTGSSTPDEKSQSPTVETTINSTVPPIANHMGDRTSLGGIPVPLQPLAAELQAVISGTSPGTSNSQSPSIPSEFSGTGTPSPDSTSGKKVITDAKICRTACTIENKTSATNSEHKEKYAHMCRIIYNHTQHPNFHKSQTC